MSLPIALPSLVLGSVSPRRRQLLDNLGLPYSVVDPDATEAHPDAKSVDEVTQRNALSKARSVLRRITSPDTVIVGADTLVVVEEAVLGKPRDKEDAVRMLRLLSGREHEVVSGLALVSPRYGERTRSVRSRLRFRSLSPEDIEDYLSTREPWDKAGAYAVQGLAMLFIERVEGSYTNIVGLPLEALLEELAALTSIPLPNWFR